MTNKKYLWGVIVLVVLAVSTAIYFVFLRKNPSSPNTSDTIDNTGKKVYVNYIGTYQNGEVFDTNIKEVAKKSGVYDQQADQMGKYKPIDFIVGTPGMIAGFDSAVKDMKVGTTKKVTILPKDGYGEYDSGLIKTLPKSQFQEANIVPEVGQTYNNGAFKVLEVTNDSVKADFNNKMAGKTLQFEITLESMDIPQK